MSKSFRQHDRKKTKKQNTQLGAILACWNLDLGWVELFQPLCSELAIRSAVRLRFGEKTKLAKKIQSRGNFTVYIFQYHTEVVYNIQWYNLTKKSVLPASNELCIDFWYFLVDNWLAIWPFFSCCPSFKCSFNKRNYFNFTILYIVPSQSWNI